MQQYMEVLKNTKIFAGLGEDDITAMLNCLNARIKTYKKGGLVLCQGEISSKILILLEGNLHIQSDDYWGNRTILSKISVGEMFGEAYALPESGEVINDVSALEDSKVMLFDIDRVLSVCPSACRFHSAVIENLFSAISEKNRILVQKLSVISKRTTREKLISYLSGEAKRNNSPVFDIPFNRQQLADFLSVDRSAMSNELCKMRDEGLLEFNKNHFKLLLN